MQYTRLYLARHNAIVARVRIAALLKFDVISENQAIGAGGLRPDLVLRRKSDGHNFIVDVTIPFDNRLSAFTDAAATRKERYSNFSREMSLERPAEVVPFVIGALGSWDPNNEYFMSKLCSHSYATKMRKLYVSDVISYSRNIYLEHLIGTRQREI